MAAARLACPLNSVRCDVDAVHYRFGHFLLQPDRRCLSAAGVPVSVSARALDLLTLLVERRDRVVTKDEILASVWAGSIVEENNLAVQVSALRRLLGTAPDGGQYIMTVPGRGYRFVAPLLDEVADTLLTPDVPAPVAATGSAARRRRAGQLAAAGVAVLLAGFTIIGVHHGPARAPRLSIAVLPFRNLNGDPQRDYLADAVSDDINTDLSHLPGSVVIARESAETFKGRGLRVEEIGQILGVRYLLHGSLWQEGATLHVNAQLIDASNGHQLWAHGFDVGQDALGTARDEIVRHLARALDFTLVQIESARARHERPNNADAVDDYLQARSRLDGNETLAGLVAAQQLLEQAVSLVPGYGDAQALLALVLLRKIGSFDDVDDWQDHAAAEHAVQAALSASPGDPMAITARGTLAWLDEHCERAEPDFRMALSLDPNDMAAQDGLARCLGELGRMSELVDTLRTALRIDPTAPGNAPRQNLLGLGLLMLDRPSEALPWLQRARVDVSAEAAPGLALGWQEWNRLNLIVAAQQAGDARQAGAEYALYNRLWPYRTVWQLASRYSRARAALAAQQAYLLALHQAGMPMFEQENQDFGIPPTASSPPGGDVEPTPLTLPGATRIDTAGVAALVGNPAGALVLDTGRGAAVIPGAVLVWRQDEWGDRQQILLDAFSRSTRRPDQPVIVMGDGVLGWSSYGAALTLIAHGVHPVLWYRGGEEAWVAAGHAFEDKRP